MPVGASACNDGTHENAKAQPATVRGEATGRFPKAGIEPTPRGFQIHGPTCNGFSRRRLRSVRTAAARQFKGWIGMPLSPSLDTIRDDFVRLTAALDAHASCKVFDDSPTDNGKAHAEQRGGTFAYVVTERGQELERRETRDPDELLYWLVSDVARDAAQRYEGNHRQPGADFRRLYFQQHVELLSQLRPEWGERTRQEYERVLERHPFSDGD